MPIKLGEDEELLYSNYSPSHQNITRYLLTIARPSTLLELLRKEYSKFRRDALTYLVQGKQLFKRASRNIPLRRVIDDPDKRKLVIRRCHEASGHRSDLGTYIILAGRY